MYMPAPMGTESHLWASKVMELAREIPSRTGRSSGTRAAAPPQAASTWSQIPSSSATWAISATGSTTPALVEPSGGHHQEGREPCLPVLPDAGREVLRDHPQPASTRISRTASVPSPASRAALRKEWCASGET